MAYKCLFMDNDIYTAQDVNDAISNIVSSGVCGYPFGVNALSDLNTAIEELSEGGVNYRGTACLLVNNGGTYKVSEGACIMNDGAQIIFDEDGYEIAHEVGVYEYVYLERDLLHNSINVVVSQEAGGQDTIPLAEIKTDGTVIDRRRFAIAKVSLSAEPQNISVAVRLDFTVSGNSTYSYDIGFNGWKYIIVRTGNAYIDILELNDNESTNSFPRDNAVGSSTSHIRYYNDVYVTRRGSMLEFQNQYGSDRSYAVGFEVR